MTETRKTNRGLKALIALLTICIILLLFSTAASAAVLGDVNGDGTINILDVVLVNNHVLGNSTLTATQLLLADVNRDGKVDIFDLVLIMQMASGMIYEFPVLPAPTLSAPANNTLVSSDYVSFQWNSVSGATRYELEVSKVSDGSIFKTLVLGTTGTTQLGFPNDGTQFRWRARAGNNDGWGSWSSYRNFANGYAPADQTSPPPAAPAPSSPVVPTVTIPSAPTLSLPGANSTVAGNSISFQWNPSTGADKYELRVIKVSDGSTFRTQLVGNYTYSNQIGFPNDGTIYRWQVRSGNDSGWSSWSSESTFTNSGGLGIPILTSPSINANVFGSAITFRWNAASGATRYEIQVLNENRSVYRSDTLGTATSTTFYGFPNDGRKFTWRVRAGNASSLGTWSEERTFHNGNLPAAPELLTPTSGETAGGSSVRFSWKESAGANNYNLQVVRVRDNLVVKNPILGNSTSTLQTGFPDDGTAYKWRVRAGSSDGWGEWSGYREFISGSLAVPTLTYPANNANIAATSIRFEWNPVYGANRYQLKITQGEGTSMTTFREVTFSSVYATIQRYFPNDGSEFQWQVRAGNSLNNTWGDWSVARTLINGTPVKTPVQLAPVANGMVEMGYSAADAVYNTVDFSWTPVTDATIYQLEVTRVRDGLVVINDNSITDSPSTQAGFEDGEQYKWRVRAGIGTSPNYTWSVWSPYRDFVSYEELPELAAPSLSSPASYATASGETVEFKWSKVKDTGGADVNDYILEIYYAVGGGLYRRVTVADGPDTIQSSPQAGFLDDSTQYIWRVRAVDAVDGPGAWSLFRGFTNGSWWSF